jgi:hypothetical protein
MLLFPMELELFPELGCVTDYIMYETGTKPSLSQGSSEISVNLQDEAPVKHSFTSADWIGRQIQICIFYIEFH